MNVIIDSFQGHLT